MMNSRVSFKINKDILIKNHAIVVEKKIMPYYILLPPFHNS
jgi:hypothetical protein